MTSPPSLVLVAGPNSTGKSTTAKALLRTELGIEEFVDADVIARGLSGFAPEEPADGPVAGSRARARERDRSAWPRLRGRSASYPLLGALLRCAPAIERLTSREMRRGTAWIKEDQGESDARSFCTFVLLVLGLASRLAIEPEAQQHVLEDGTKLSGFHRFHSVLVPADSTVWVEEDLVLEALGDIVIDGALRAVDRPRESNQDGPTICLATPSRLIVSGEVLGGRGGVAKDNLQQGPFGSHVLVESPSIIVDGSFARAPGEPEALAARVAGGATFSFVDP